MPKHFGKAILIGVAGGLAGSFAMNQFQSLLSSLEKKKEQPQQQQNSEDSDDATVKTAKAISSNVFGHQLTKDEKQWAGPAVHYGFGTALGVAYSVAAEMEPSVTVGCGTGYATAVWLGADEIGVPLTGLSKAPTEYPASSHARALASHLIYGVTLDLVRRLLL